jgi:hypothetical protein
MTGTDPLSQDDGTTTDLRHGRALATVETISSLVPIEGADRIELARVLRLPLM